MRKGVKAALSTGNPENFLPFFINKSYDEKQ